MLRALLLWLAFINLVTYGVYWLDKRRAEKGKWRISEKELLLWAAAGGSPAAFLAMRRFRHKTNKTSFRFWYWLIVVAQLAGLFFLLRSQS
ncbi:MAG: DUF1294 domain-containing protein [Planctomycetota bacterium]